MIVLKCFVCGAYCGEVRKGRVAIGMLVSCAKCAKLVEIAVEKQSLLESQPEPADTKKGRRK